MRWHALLWPLLALLCVQSVMAQTPTGQSDEGVVMETPFVVGIEGNSWEAGLLVGYLGLNHKLMGGQSLVVDIETPDDLLFADMELEGEFGFAPKLMINYLFGSHFAFESSLTAAFGSFKQTVGQNQRRWLNPNSNNTITENEIETGSYFALLHDHSLTWYPRGEGRLQPYLTAGAGTHWFELDSDYIAEGLHGGFGFGYGAGLRVIGDDLYSLRIEIRNYHSKVEYPVAEKWRDEQNIAGNAILSVPVMELVDTSTLSEEEIAAIYDALELSDPGAGLRPVDFPRIVDSFESESYSSLYFSIGFSAAF